MKNDIQTGTKLTRFQTNHCIKERRGREESLNSNNPEPQVKYKNICEQILNSSFVFQSGMS